MITRSRFDHVHRITTCFGHQLLISFVLPSSLSSSMSNSLHFSNSGSLFLPQISPNFPPFLSLLVMSGLGINPFCPHGPCLPPLTPGLSVIIHSSNTKHLILGTPLNLWSLGVDRATMSPYEAERASGGGVGVGGDPGGTELKYKGTQCHQSWGTRSHREGFQTQHPR